MAIKETISWHDFEKIDMRVGTVTAATFFAEARKPAFQVWIDFGEEIGERKTSAQITAHYQPDELIGKQVIAVVNFPPKQIGKFMSECLILGIVGTKGDVILLHPERSAENGQAIG